MRRQKSKIAIVFILIMIVGIGYAFFSGKLTINGTSNFSANSWLIYFDDIRPNVSNNVEATEPAVITDSAKTNISFDVNLDKPGDFYEFDVYIKNDGTIDAMIDEVIMPELTEEEKKYLSFSYTYVDGTKIKKCDELKANSFKDTRLRVEFMEDGDFLLVQDDTDRHFDVTIKYVQDGECERPADEYTLTIDPDGGIYDESTELRTVRLSSGEVYTLATPTKEGFDFEGWEEVTETSSLNNNVVTVGEGNIRVKAIWIDSSTPTINLTINPDGGIYNESSEPTIVTMRSGRTYKVAKPTKEGYTFVRWEEVSETNTYSDFQVVAGEVNIELKAIWGDKIAKIVRGEDQFYSSIQAAIDDASNGETIYLLKNTTEEFVNNKNVTIDLSGHKVTGTGTNQTGYSLTLLNGSIENTNGIGFTNEGTLTIGINDDNLCDVSNKNITCAYENGFVSILGTTRGLNQDGTFNFYDGFIEGKLAIVGEVNDTPVYDSSNENDIKYYSVLIDQDIIRQDQIAYLKYIDESNTMAVSKTIVGGTIYYVDLSDNFKVSADTGYKVYAVRDFQGAYVVEVPADSTIEFDIIGKKVELGNSLNVNGTLKLMDSAFNKKELDLSHPINLNGNLYLNNIDVKSDAEGENLIDVIGNSTINLTTSTLTSINGNTINNTGNLTIISDENSRVDSKKIAIFSKGNTIINGGNYSGGTDTYGSIITIASGKTTFNSGIVESITPGYDNKIVYLSDHYGSGNAEFEMNGGEINSPNYGIQCDHQTLHTVHIKDGNVNQNVNGCTLIIDGGSIVSNNRDTVYSNKITMNAGVIRNDCTNRNSCDAASGGSLTMTGGSIISQNGTAINGTVVDIKNGTVDGIVGINNPGRDSVISGGTIHGTEIGITKGRYGSSFTTTITGGTIIGDIYGIRQDDYTLNIGEAEENGIPSKTSPVIIGGTYGIYKTGGIATINDGLFKGKTASIEGNINYYTEGYTLYTNDIEEIEESDDVYHLAYLVEMAPFLQVGENTYNSFTTLFKNESSETLTINVIDDGGLFTEQSIPVGKTVVLNLNGHTINATQTLVNKGDLTINDTKVIEDGNEVYKGKFINETGSPLKTQNKLVVNGGNFEGYAYAGDDAAIIVDGGTVELNETNVYLRKNYYENTAINIINNNCYVELTDVNIYSDLDGIKANWSGGGSQVKMNSGTINATRSAVKNCIFTMDDGTLHSEDVTVADGKFTMNGGTVTSDSFTVIYWNEININDGLIQGKTIEEGYPDAAIVSCTGTISGGKIKGFHGVKGSPYGSITMTGGEIEAIESGFTNVDDLVITGGTVKGGKYGVYNDYGGYKITIGSDDDNINIAKPIIIGEINGVKKIDTSFLYIYDGKIKGKTNHIDGEVNGMADGCVLKDDETETIEGEEYKIAYLKTTTPFLQVGEHTYNSFNQVFKNEEADTLTIEVVENGIITHDQTIPEGKTVVLNLNGKTITSTSKITNNGDFTINDDPIVDGEDVTYQGGFVLNGSNLITSNNKLTFNGGKITATSRVDLNPINLKNGSADLNAGIITINRNYDKDIKWDYAILVDTNDVSINIRDGFNIYNYGVTYSNNGQSHGAIYCSNYKYSDIHIYGGHLEGGDDVIYDCNVTMDAGEIVSRYSAIRSHNFVMNGGTITGTNNGIVYGENFELNDGLIECKGETNYGNCTAVSFSQTTINGGTIKSNKIGIDGGSRGTTINQGDIIAGTVGITTYNNVNVLGGTIIGGTYGIEQHNGTLILGENEENGIPSKSVPSIKGGTYGLYKAGGTFKFYDGIIKGKTGAIEGIVTDIATSSFIKTTSESVTENEEPVTYEVKYLEQEYEFITNTTKNKNYSNFAEAMSKADDDDEFEVFKTASSYEVINIDKNVTIDFKGFDIVAENGIIIESGKTVLFKNTNTSNKSKISTNLTVNLIKNYGTLTIEDVKLENLLTYYYIIENYGILTLNRVDVNARDFLNEDVSTENYLNDCNITTTDMTISLRGTTEIDGGTWTISNDYMISTDNVSNVTIDNLTSTGGININDASTFEINDSTIGKQLINKGTITLTNVIHNANHIGGSSEYNYSGGVLEYNGGSLIVDHIGEWCGNCSLYALDNNGEAKYQNVTINMTNSLSSEATIFRQASNTPLEIKNTTMSNIYGSKLVGISVETGTINIEDSNITVGSNDNYLSTGIRTKSTGVVNNTNTKVNVTGETAYGIYIDEGTVNVPSDNTEIKVSGETVYGAYVNKNTGKLYLGDEDTTTTNEENADVSLTKPYIEAIGTTSGYGIFNNNGWYEIYDGKLVGSTNAFNKAPSRWQHNWQLTEFTDENTNNKYGILIYLHI